MALLVLNQMYKHGCATKAEMTNFSRHWLFVNMPFTKEDTILIKKNCLSYKAKMLNIWSESFSAKAGMSAASTSCCSNYTSCWVGRLSS